MVSWAQQGLQQNSMGSCKAMKSLNVLQNPQCILEIASTYPKLVARQSWVSPPQSRTTNGPATPRRWPAQMWALQLPGKEFSRLSQSYRWGLGKFKSNQSLRLVLVGAPTTHIRFQLKGPDQHRSSLWSATLSISTASGSQKQFFNTPEGTAA